MTPKWGGGVANNLNVIVKISYMKMGRHSVK